MIQVVGELVVDIPKMEKMYPITDRKLLIKCGVVLACVIMSFFLHPLTHLDPAWIAIMGAVWLLVAFDMHHCHEVPSRLHACGLHKCLCCTCAALSQVAPMCGARQVDALTMNAPPRHQVGRPQTGGTSARATDALCLMCACLCLCLLLVCSCSCSWNCSLYPPRCRCSLSSAPSLAVWPSQALMGVEWDTLLFFAALFVVVEGVSEMGLLRFIANTLSVFDPALPPAAAAVAQTVSSTSSTRRREARWGCGFCSV